MMVSKYGLIFLFLFFLFYLYFNMLEVLLFAFLVLCRTFNILGI